MKHKLLCMLVYNTVPHVIHAVRVENSQSDIRLNTSVRAMDMFVPECSISDRSEVTRYLVTNNTFNESHWNPLLGLHLQYVWQVGLHPVFSTRLRIHLHRKSAKVQHQYHNSKVAEVIRCIHETTQTQVHPDCKLITLLWSEVGLAKTNWSSCSRILGVLRKVISAHIISVVRLEKHTASYMEVSPPTAL